MEVFVIKGSNEVKPDILQILSKNSKKFPTFASTKYFFAVFEAYCMLINDLENENEIIVC